MKKCAYEGCNKDIEVWQTYCPQHYEMLMQQQTGQVVQEPPKIPEQRVAMPKPKVESKLPNFPAQQENGISDKEKMIRKECLRCAVDLIIATEDLNKPYSDLLGQIRQLVSDFYKIVSEA